MIQLYENPGWGSAIVELQLAFYGLPHALVTAGNVHQDPIARAALGGRNGNGFCIGGCGHHANLIELS